MQEVCAPQPAPPEGGARSRSVWTAAALLLSLALGLVFVAARRRRLMRSWPPQPGLGAAPAPAATGAAAPPQAPPEQGTTPPPRVAPAVSAAEAARAARAATALAAPAAVVPAVQVPRAADVSNVSEVNGTNGPLPVCVSGERRSAVVTLLMNPKDSCPVQLPPADRDAAGLGCPPPRFSNAWADNASCADWGLGRFSGCPTLQQRAAQWRMDPAELTLCGDLWRSGLGQVARRYESAPCRIVVASAIYGAYDTLPPDPAVADRARLERSIASGEVCFVFMYDTRTAAAGLKGIGSVWRTELVDPLPYPGELARSFVTTKLLAHRLFPAAESILSVDGKVVLTAHPVDILGSRALGDAGLVLIKHPYLPDTEIEFYGEFYQKRHDCERVERQHRQYRDEGFKGQGQVDSCMIVMRRPRAPCVQRLLCAWHTEVALFSYREQLSFFRTVDALGVRDSVTLVHFGVFMNWAKLRDHAARQPKGTCRKRPGRKVRGGRRR
eukprot:TRINITY_DN11194_c0_g1_i1.p1 TRINITY_DN11194_c0_g1~~TRINITY_DN11194_c0_g1_i1.p1  ORF type:complete len:524 (+),score=133.59 TRINITY_DN11194_c0_g1_i1:82-1572(+)